MCERVGWLQVLRSGSFSSLSYLEAENFRLNEIQRLAIDFDKAFAFLLPAQLSVSFQFFLRGDTR
jgi:hypothetical protein